MSFTVSKNVKFSDVLQEVSQNEFYETGNMKIYIVMYVLILFFFLEVSLLGGVLSNVHHVWHAKGPCLEVRNTKSGLKVGGWTFGCISRESNIEIVCVEELKSNGGLSLLMVALNCKIRGGLICLFNIFSSKVIRTIEIKEKVCNISGT